MKNNSIPSFVFYYTIFLCVLGFGAAAIGYFAPQMMFSTIKVDFAQITTVTGMFGARNLAFGVMAFMALYAQDARYYLLLFVGRFVTEVQDVLVIIFTNAAPLPAFALLAIWAVMFILPELLAIRSLQKNITSEIR